MLYQPDAKAYGLSGTADLNEYLCFTGLAASNLKFGEGDNSYLSIIAGVGVKQRVIFSNAFLFQIKLYPYVGYGNANEAGEYHSVGKSGYHDHSEKNEFLYGAAADAQIGFKLSGSNDSGKTFKSTYLTVGYLVSADKFKTENMFKYGYIMAGLTFIM